MSEYKEDLLEDLKDADYSAKYLSAAIRDSREAFLVALRDVVEARKGMAKVAREAGVNRENLYRLLSEDGNPRLSSLHAVLETLGLQLFVEAEKLPPRRSHRALHPAPTSRASKTSSRRS